MGERNRIGYVFPGQGSQYVGMGRELCEEFDEAREVFLEAEEILGFPVRQLCFSGPESDLKLTEFTQPAILTVSIAALRVFQSRSGLEPSCVAGHSLGEYSALVSVGALDFRDAVKVVGERGKLMQEAVPPGEGLMAVIMGLAVAEVERICEEAAQGEVVAPANFNGGGQIVIAGKKGAIARAMALARERGAKRVLELPVSAPFHCPLMNPVCAGLEKTLNEVKVHPFSTGVITNVEGALNSDYRRVKSLLVEQAVRPVRWEESVKQMEHLGCGRIMEIGPGKVLKGLIRRISPGLEVENFEVPGDLQKFANA